MQDLADSQNEDGSIPDVAPVMRYGAGAPGWSDVVVMLPWNIYHYYGDTRIIEDNFDAMSGWVNWMRGKATDGLYVRGRFGDWVPVETSPKETLAGAYQYLSTKRLGLMAQAIGQQRVARTLADQAEAIAQEFNERYLDTKTNHYKGATQTANAVPLHFGIVPENKRQAVIDNIAADIIQHDNHLTTGFIGTAYLMPTLSDYGRDDLAAILANNRDYPSWGYMVESGATTIWERWNSNQPEALSSGMNSFNHFTFGSVGQWYYEYLLGIRPLEPGFKRILIDPRTDAAQWAKGSIESMYGSIRCAWDRTDGFTMTVTIPANTAALVRTPVPCDADLEPDDTKTVDADGATAFEIGAGEYTFIGS